MPRISSFIHLLSILAAGSCWSAESWWDRLDQDSLPPADQPVHEVIDQLIAAKLEAAGAAAAPLAPPETRIRRVTLDLAGRIPALVEADRFLRNEAPDRWETTVQQLLADPAFDRFQAHELNWLIFDGRTGEYRDFLKREVAKDVRWPQIFAQTMDARNDGSEDLKGSDQFLREKVRDIDKLANDVSVRFFGVNISCAQCHDHPYVEDWTQDTYYGMTSFFSRSFENGGFVAEREYGLVSYKPKEGDERQPALRFLGGEALEEPAPKELTDEEKKEEKKRLEEFKKNKQQPPAPAYSRRARLTEAALADGNEQWFARSLANRVWHRFFGRGLVEPLDQMHGQNVPSHPELIEWLARDLMAHDYDLRRLMGGIARSQAYQRDSVWNSAERPAPELFAVANPRPLTPRQYGISLKIASASPMIFPEDLSREDFLKRIESFENGGEGLGNQFERPGAHFNFAVDEALYFSNSEDARNQLLKAGLVDSLEPLESDEARIQAAYRSILLRPAAADEVETLKSYLDARTDRPRQALEQVVWALLTSAEARFNH